MSTQYTQHTAEVLRTQNLQSNDHVRVFQSLLEKGYLTQQKQIKELKKKLAEAGEAAAALFASVGDTFTHATDDRGNHGDVFEYEGRTSEGWLIFHHLEGGGFHGYHGLNGGVRDAIGAFPVSTYEVQLPNGERDLDRIKLPPSMCYMFRKK